MNQQIIAMTPSVRLERELLTTGSFVFCDNQSACGQRTNPARPVGVYWKSNDTAANVVPMGWSSTEAPFIECPFCTLSSINLLGEEEWNNLEHNQQEVEGSMMGNQGTTGSTVIHRQTTPSLNSPTSPTNKQLNTKSKSHNTPSDKDLLAHAKKMGMPISVIKSMKDQLKQNKKDASTNRLFEFKPTEYTPSKSKSKSKSKKKKRKYDGKKSKSRTKKSKKK